MEQISPGPAICYLARTSRRLVDPSTGNRNLLNHNRNYWGVTIITDLKAVVLGSGLAVIVGWGMTKLIINGYWRCWRRNLKNETPKQQKGCWIERMEFHQRTIIIVHGQFLLVIAEQFATMYQVGVKTQLQMKCSGGGERRTRLLWWRHFICWASQVVLIRSRGI